MRLAPKLGEKCLYISQKRKLECGYNQECNENYGICMCKKNYIASNKQCTLLAQDDELFTLINYKNASVKFVNDLARNPLEDDDDNDEDGHQQSTGNSTNKNMFKLSQGTLRALVLFLFIIAILLCIALAIVIIWRLVQV